MHLFSTRLSSGILYEVDARLRPEGAAGPLICTLSGYEQYLENKAWTWELQALVRARAVLGSERLINKFNEIVNTLFNSIFLLSNFKFLSGEYASCKTSLVTSSETLTLALAVQSTSKEPVLFSSFFLNT